MKSLVSTFLISAMSLLGFAVPASASTGQTGGVIGNIFAYATSGAMDFQVTFKYLPTICPGHTIAYVNVTDPNYKEVVTDIIQARYELQSEAGINLYIYWTTDTNGYCHITGAYYDPKPV